MFNGIKHLSFRWGKEQPLPSNSPNPYCFIFKGQAQRGFFPIGNAEKNNTTPKAATEEKVLDQNSTSYP